MFELMVGLRYLHSRRQGSLASVVALVAMLGVVLGVAALIIVISVMNGFERDLEQKILGTNAHIRVYNFARHTGLPRAELLRQRLEKVPGVLAAAPVIDGEVLLKGHDQVMGVKLRGIDPVLESRVTELGNYLTRGQFAFPEENGIILGEELALFLGVNPGDEVLIVSPTMMLTPLGMSPRTVTARVVGCFRSGMYEYDCIMALVPLPLAGKLFGTGPEPTAIELKVADTLRAESLARQIKEELRFALVVKSWQEINRSLFSAIQLEKVTMFVILTLIIFVAAFNVAGSLIMMVIEKTKDIGILKALGASSRSVMKIFFLEGLIIGLGGILLGGLVGGLVCWFLAAYGLPLPSDVYYIDNLPVDTRAPDVALIILGTLFLTLLAAVYPAWRAARLDPVAAIRLE